MNSFKLIREYIFKYKWRYAAGIILVLMVDILQMILPKILEGITDAFRLNSLTTDDIFRNVFYISMIAILSFIMRFFWRYLMFGASRRIETDLREQLFVHIQKLPIGYFHRTKTGDIMAHATNDLNNVRMALGQGLMMSIDVIFIPLVTIYLMVGTISAKLTVITFAPLVLLLILTMLIVRRTQNRARKMQEAFSTFTDTVRENFTGIRVVKAFVQELNQINKFDEVNENNKNSNLRYIRIMGLMSPIIQAFLMISFGISLIYGGLQVIYNDVSLGKYIAFNTYLIMLTWPMSAFGWALSLFQRGIVSIERISDIITEPIPENKIPVDSSITSLKGNIQFKNVSFKYAEKDESTLNRINLRIEQGKTLAIVGKTGSGKTTLINLLLRLFDPVIGHIFIDGIDIRKIPVNVLRENIGYVPQDIFLFSTSIKENIRFFSGIYDEKVEWASRIAQVYSNIMAFPDKFDTFVGERGVNLSGGQKQRISIARSISKDPSIYIFDDCLSAVDTHTEEEILHGLREVTKGKTCIIISHRISTVKDSDEIVVLDEGEIVERGTNKELMELHGYYYELHHRQMLEDRLEVDN